MKRIGLTLLTAVLISGPVHADPAPRYEFFVWGSEAVRLPLRLPRGKTRCTVRWIDGLMTLDLGSPSFMMDELGRLYLEDSTEAGLWYTRHWTDGTSISYRPSDDGRWLVTVYFGNNCVESVQQPLTSVRKTR